MRIIFQKIDQATHTFQVKLLIRQPDDIWHLMHLINNQDHIKAKTSRKVVKETDIGMTHSQRKTFEIVMKVLSVEYLEDADILRISGTNASSSHFMKIGQHHSLEVGINSKLVLIKHRWDALHLSRIQMARDDNKSNTELAVILMEEGIAHLFKVGKSTTHLKTKITKSIPKKKSIPTQHDKALRKFYDACSNALYSLAHDVTAIVIASPGFIKEHFYKHFQNHKLAGAKNSSKIEQKITLVHSSSGYKHSLSQVLEDKAVSQKLASVGGDSQVLSKFYKMLETDQDRVLFGLKSVTMACQASAIDYLLVTDGRLNSGTGGAYKMKQRMNSIKLLQDVRKAGGNVNIFSSKSPSGQKIDDLGGFAAILRFPMPEVENDGSDQDNSDDDLAEDEQEEKQVDTDANLDDLFWNEMKLSDEEDNEKASSKIEEVKDLDEEEEEEGEESFI